MSLYRINSGLQIESFRDNVTDSANTIQVIKAKVDPTITGIDAPIGSFLLRTDTGDAYTKVLGIGNPTAWSVMASSAEDNFQNTFMGKIRGNFMPVYSSVQVITQGSNLETAISELDAEVYVLSEEMAQKITANAPITASTATKITYDTHGLVTGGTNLSASDIPTIAESQVSGLVSDLASKLNANTAITAATSTKVIYDIHGLVTAGTNLSASDIPNISESQVTNLTSDLSAKAPINSPSFSGTVSGITSSMVGLGNVSNDAQVKRSEMGVSNGVATLGIDGTLLATQIPASLLGQVQYKGSWDASLNSPTIPVPSSANKGWYYICIVAGSTPITTSIGVVTNWAVGDWIVSDGTYWDQIKNADAVLSVNGHVGIVTLTASDIGLSNVNNTSDSNKNVLSATKLTTTRNINGVSFDGTADITVYDSTKVVANTTITAGTGTKITYDAKGLVLSATTLAASDIPTLTASKISDFSSATLATTLVSVVPSNSALASGDSLTTAFGKIQGQINSFSATVTLTGDVTGTGSGSVPTSISASTVTGKVLTGYSIGSNTAISATDSILSAFEKVQAQINAGGGGGGGIYTSITSVPAYTFLGNNTASSANAIALSATQAKTLLSIASTDVSGLTAWATKSYPIDASGLLRDNGSGTLSWDTSAYITGNQNITVSGDASGSGTTTIALTVNALKNVSVPSLTTGNLRYNGTSLIWDSATYITANQSISFNPSGDVTGTASGTTSLTPTLTIGSGVVTLAKMANLAANSIIGNNTASSATPIALTYAQVKSALAITSSDVSGLTAWATKAYPTDASGLLRNNGTGTLSWDTSTYLTTSTAASTYQPLSVNLTSVSALTYSSTSFVKMTSANTFSLDTTAYLSLAGGTMTKPLNITDPANSGSTYEIVITDTATNTAKLGTNGLAITVGAAGFSVTASGGLNGGSASGSYGYGLGSSWTYGGTTFSSSYTGINHNTSGHASNLSASDLVFDGVSIFTRLAPVASPTFTGTITTPLTTGFVKSNSGGVLSVDTNTYEPSLGNPSVNGYVLSSTAAGVRSWVVMSGGGGSITLTGDTTGTGTGSIATTTSAIRNVSIPSLSTGFLKYTGSAWSFDASTYFATTTTAINAANVNNSLVAISGTAFGLGANGNTVINLSSNSLANTIVTSSTAITTGLSIVDSSDPSTVYQPWVAINAVSNTNTTLSGLQTIDGILLVDGNTVLLYNMTTASQNGVYIVHSGAWARHPRLTTADQIRQTIVYVLAGTTYQGFSWMCSTNGNLVVGSTAITYTLMPIFANAILYNRLSTSAVGGFLGHSGTSLSSITMISSSTQYQVPVIGASSALAFGYLTPATLQNSFVATTATAATFGSNATTLITASTSGTLSFAVNPTFSAITTAGHIQVSNTGVISVDTASYEPALGNPSTNGYVLSSTTAGVRSWIAMSGGGGSVTLTGDVTGSGTSSVPTTVSRIQNSVVPSLSTGNLRYSGSSWVFDSTSYLPSTLTALNNAWSGFINSANVITTFNGTTSKTLTLTGTFSAYWQGTLVSALTSGWTSPAYTGTPTSPIYLAYNGTTFAWTTTFWDLSQVIPIAIIAFDNSGNYLYCQHESHDMMPFQSHIEDHFNIGTWRQSGGTISNIIINSTTTANRQPYTSATTVWDEDLQTVNAAQTTNSYTTLYFTGSSQTPVFTQTQSDIVALSGSTPQYNQWTGSTWQLTNYSNNTYGTVWQIAIPTGYDSVGTQSQNLRYVYVQGQSIGTLSAMQATTPANLNISALSTIFTEAVFINRFIIRYTAGNWTITQYDTITGSRAAQFVSSANTVVSLQTAYNNSTIPQIVTSVLLGGFEIQGGSGTDTDPAFAIVNNAGNPTLNIAANGSITAPTSTALSLGSNGIGGLITIASTGAYAVITVPFIRTYGTTTASTYSITTETIFTFTGTSTLTITAPSGSNLFTGRELEIINNGSASITFSTYTVVVGSQLNIRYTGSAWEQISFNYSNAGIETIKISTGTGSVGSFNGQYGWIGIVIPTSTTVINTMSVLSTQSGSGTFALAIYNASYNLIAQTGAITGAVGLLTGTLGSTVTLLKNTIYYFGICGSINGALFVGMTSAYQSNPPYMAVSNSNISSFPSTFSGSSDSTRFWIGAYA